MKVLWRTIRPSNHLYQMTRHFVWLAPLTYLLLFLAMGLFLATVTRLWPRRGGWLSRRLIVACALMPVLMVAGPQIYRDQLAILVAAARPHCDDFAFLRFFLSGVGNDDAAFGFLLGVDAFDDHAVMERPELGFRHDYPHLPLSGGLGVSAKAYGLQYLSTH